MEAVNFPTYFDAPSSVITSAYTPVSQSQYTQSPVNLPKSGAAIQNLGIQAAKLAFAGAGGVSLPPIDMSAQSSAAPSTSKAGDISAGAVSFSTGAVNFGSGLLGAAITPQSIMVLGALGLVIALVLLKKGVKK